MFNYRLAKSEDESGRCFETCKKEHIRNVKTCANGSNSAKHAWQFDHRIDYDNSSVIDNGSVRIRKTLEAWHTSATEHADSNSKPIPNQYCILFKKYSPNWHIFTLFLFFLLFLSRLFCINYIHLVFHFYPSKAVERQPKSYILLKHFKPVNVFIVVFIRLRVLRAKSIMNRDSAELK